MNIDKLSNRILQILKNNGRITNSDLAAQVNLSPSACLRRVQDLEKEGVIRGYRTILDKNKTGRGFVTYVMVGLDQHTKMAQQAFENAIKQSDDVVECHNVTGTFEYILRVETPDLDAYKKFHSEVLGVSPHLRSINTHVVMDSPKDTRA